jgi:hypothetical protein
MPPTAESPVTTLLDSFLNKKPYAENRLAVTLLTMLFVSFTKYTAVPTLLMFVLLSFTMAPLLASIPFAKFVILQLDILTLDIPLSIKAEPLPEPVREWPLQLNTMLPVLILKQSPFTTKLLSSE